MVDSFLLYLIPVDPIEAALTDAWSRRTLSVDVKPFGATSWMSSGRHVVREPGENAKKPDPIEHLVRSDRISNWTAIRSANPQPSSRMARMLRGLLLHAYDGGGTIPETRRA